MTNRFPIRHWTLVKAAALLICAALGAWEAARHGLATAAGDAWQFVRGIADYQLNKIAETFWRKEWLEYFADTYVYSTAALTVLVLLVEIGALSWEQGSLRNGWEGCSLRRLLFRRSKSTRSDLYLFVYNKLALDSPVVAFLSLSGPIFVYMLLLTHCNLQLFQYLASAPLQFVAFILVQDLVNYWFHRLCHIVPALWEIHKFHHAATEFNIITGVRDHPFEKTLQSMLTALPLAFLGFPIEYYMTFIAVQIVLSSFLHSMVSWTYGWVGRWLLISPMAHRVHHSMLREHWNKNYGVVFSIWDRIFGSRYSGTNYDVVLGVTGNFYNRKSFLHDLWMPFRNFWLVLFGLKRSSLSSGKPPAAPSPPPADLPKPAPRRHAGAPADGSRARLRGVSAVLNSCKKHFMPPHNSRQWLYLLALTPVFASTYSLAHWLRFDGNLSPDRLTYLQVTLVWVMLVKLAVFGWFRVHHGWGRSATFHDMVVLAEASTASSVFIAVVDYLLFNRSSIPRSVFLMDWGITLLILGGLRTVTRLIQERYQPLLFSSDGLRALIVGANEAGQSLLRGIKRSRHLRYNVVGFLDHAGGRVGARLDGVPVLGDWEQLSALAAAYEVREVLVSAGELPGRRLRKLVEECRTHDLRIKVLPSFEQLMGDEVALRVREVSIEDLLRRDPVQLDLEGILQSLSGRTLMVTGSAGSIGSEICRQLLQFNPGRMVLVDRSENGQFFVERELRDQAPQQDLQIVIADIADRPRMQTLFETYRPEVIFHAAAYKHVPLMEANPGEAVKNNVLATRTLADLAEEHDCGSFVMISTDKAVRPTSVMGACKRVAELYIQAIAACSRCRFVTVRFGNVLDSAGSVVPIFRQQIAQGGPVTVTDPRMQRFFMTIPEAAQLVIQGGVMGGGGEIFVLDMGDPVLIDDLARDMIRLSGLRVGEDIDIEYVGLRPGEKLFEELHLDGERHLPTRHPKIVVAEHEPHTPASVAAILERLTVSLAGGSQSVVAELQRAIPEYKRGDHLPKAPLRIVHPPHAIPAPHSSEVRVPAEHAA